MSLDEVASPVRRKAHDLTARSGVLSRKFASCLVVLTAVFIGTPALSQETGHAPDWAQSVLRPFWTGSRMTGETLLFVQGADAGPATARLLFVPTKIVTVTSANGAAVFENGRDYVWKRDSGILTLTPHSRIPFKTEAQLHPPKGAPMALGDSTNGLTSLFFDGDGSVLQTLQVAVTYDHQGKWSGYIPQPAGKELPRTLAKLKARQPLKLVVFGDSISVGAGASGTFNAPPFQPPYVGLVVEGLRARFGYDVTLKNPSEGGQDTSWAVTMAPKIADEDPDLVIIAFGMNDVGRAIPTATYIQNIQKVIDTIRQKRPDAEFILLSTMTGNSEWTLMHPALFTEYRDALSRMVGPGVALADVTSAWREIVKTKKFLDLTGNGLNHPNDFGYRVYAQVILEVLQ
jgi:acyl-CoA thioesterase I